MEKRLVIALALSLVFLSIWSKFVSKPTPSQETKTTATVITQVPIEFKAITPINTTTFASKENFTYSTNQKEITFELPAAAIKEVYFKNYQYCFLIEQGLLLLSEDKSQPLNFKLVKKDKDKVIFSYQDATKEIRKTLTFDNSKHIMELGILIRNTSNVVQKESFSLILSNRTFDPRSLEDNFLEIATFPINELVKYIPLGKIKSSKFNNVSLEGWALSLRDHYGCVIIKLEKNRPLFIQKASETQFLAGINLPSQEILPGQTQEEKFIIYLGPQDPKEIALVDPRLSGVVRFGFFDPISKVLLGLLKFFHKITFNWGWAIILLTFFIFLVLSPLSAKQMHSFKKMQELAPEIEALRKTHKDSPQKLNKEVLELYKKNHVNPFGGCLILFLQIPVFFSLYQVFMRYIGLKNSNFLWIKDLAQPDQLFTLPFSLPILGKELNILPIAMAIIMFLQQRLSFKSNAAANPEQQKMMLILFPILFGVMFYRMPSGLVLYWFMQSLLMFLYQWKISK